MADLVQHAARDVVVRDIDGVADPAQAERAQRVDLALVGAVLGLELRHLHAGSASPATAGASGAGASGSTSGVGGSRSGATTASASTPASASVPAIASAATSASAPAIVSEASATESSNPIASSLLADRPRRSAPS